MVEQLPLKQLVGGPNPPAPTSLRSCCTAELRLANASASNIKTKGEDCPAKLLSEAGAFLDYQIWRVRLSVRTSDFQSEKTGPTPVPATTKKSLLTLAGAIYKLGLVCKSKSHIARWVWHVQPGRGIIY